MRGIFVGYRSRDAHAPTSGGVHEFPEGTKTAGDAASVVGCDVAQIASGPVFVAGGEPVMVVISEADQVSEA